MARGLGRPSPEPSAPGDLWRLERQYVHEGYCAVAGVDEAGRGALAGPVVAAAVILPADAELPGVRDSKRLDAVQRWALYRLIRAHAVAVGLGVIEANVVDRVNVLRATHQAMAAALAGLDPPPDFALIDGLAVPGVTVNHRCLVKGDRDSYLIAAASIVAKVTRDAIMRDFDALYPGYGFAEHMGYGTPAHCEAIRRLGPCPIHRRTFAPVAAVLRPVLPGLADGRTG